MKKKTPRRGSGGARCAAVNRKTNETDISAKLAIDGTGDSHVDTGIPFFDHLLGAVFRHGFFDVQLKARGDLEVDFHHTVEDVG
ncbi:MAG: imidazoleglycerol-phosphate dehydratase, partial [Myxococcota bacterium]